MPPTEPLVSIGLPVRNGADRIADVVNSVLAQDYPNLELIISDNASTDATEEVGRELAAADSRVTYHRQPENVGLLNNFVSALNMATGPLFRWVGDDDLLAPNCVSRCVELISSDPRLILVTMQVAFIGEDGVTRTEAYDGTLLGSDDPVERFIEMLRILNESYLTLDPLAGLVRREPVSRIQRRNMLREDQVYAAKLALAGPWGHVPEILAHRVWRDETRPGLARRLDVPAWHAPMALAIQCRELLRVVDASGLDPQQRRRARAAVAKLYVGRHQRTMARRGRRVANIVNRRPLPR